MADPTDAEKLAAEKAAHDREARKTYEAISKAAGKTPEEKPELSIWERIIDMFKDKHTDKPDFIKLGIGVLGGVIGGAMGAEWGIAGIIGMALAGAAAIGIGGSFFTDYLRHDNSPPRPRALERSIATDPNAKVIAHTPVVMPQISNDTDQKITVEGKTVTVPFYDPNENPPARALREDTEKWRKIVQEGSPHGDATNRRSREILADLQKDSTQRELNLRWMRDTFAKELKVPAEQVDAYLNTLGPDAVKALSVKFDMKLDSVPGQFGAMTPSLEAFGQQAKELMLKDIGRNPENEKLVERTWTELSMPAKVAFVSNAADAMIEESINASGGDTRPFFPEHEKRAIITNTPFNLHKLLPKWIDNTVQKQFEDAYQKQDYKTMGAALEKRLADDAKMTGSDKLSDNAKERMTTLIRGLNAKVKAQELDAYIKDTVIAKELPELKKFETALIENGKRVLNLRDRMQQFEKGGSKLLVIEESKLENNRQTIKVVDTRGAPKTVSVVVTFENGSADKIKSVSVDGREKTDAAGTSLPSDSIGRIRALETLVQGAVATGAASAETAVFQEISTGFTRPDGVAQDDVSQATMLPAGFKADQQKQGQGTGAKAGSSPIM